MAESLGLLGFVGAMFGVLVLIVGAFFLFRPKQPYEQGIGLGGCFTGFMLLVIGTIVLIGMSGNVRDQQLAVSGASQVSPSLAGEASAAQRLNDSETQRVIVLANAERQNKEGQASLTLANGDFVWKSAQANKTNAEARTIEDDRNSKKIGYGGLAFADLLNNVGGVGGLLSGSVCLVLLFVGLGFLGGIKMMLGRRN